MGKVRKVSSRKSEIDEKSKKIHQEQLDIFDYILKHQINIHITQILAQAYLCNHPEPMKFIAEAINNESYKMPLQELSNNEIARISNQIECLNENNDDEQVSTEQSTSTIVSVSPKEKCNNISKDDKVTSKNSPKITVKIPNEPLAKVSNAIEKPRSLALKRKLPTEEDTLKKADEVKPHQNLRLKLKVPARKSLEKQENSTVPMQAEHDSIHKYSKNQVMEKLQLKLAVPVLTDTMKEKSNIPKSSSPMRVEIKTPDSCSASTTADNLVPPVNNDSSQAMEVDETNQKIKIISLFDKIESNLGMIHAENNESFEEKSPEVLQLTPKVTIERFDLNKAKSEENKPSDDSNKTPFVDSKALKIKLKVPNANKISSPYANMNLTESELKEVEEVAALGMVLSSESEKNFPKPSKNDEVNIAKLMLKEIEQNIDNYEKGDVVVKKESSLHFSQIINMDDIEMKCETEKEEKVIEEKNVHVNHDKASDDFEPDYEYDDE